jgi:glycosyltransferase involved in cell wall biosynthesis
VQHLASRGWSVTLLCSPGPELEAIETGPSVAITTVPMARPISLLADLRSMVGAIRALRRIRPDICNAGTPKAGLLVGLAAAATRVRCRIYTVHGLRLETSRGLQRRILALTERIAVRCAHRVICVSPSVRQRMIDLRLARPEKLVVVGLGSSSGVDVSRFAANPERLRAAAELRSEAGIPADATVIGFVGRLAADKGITELMIAWQTLAERFPTAWLLLIGDDEPGDPLPESTVREIATAARVARLAWLTDPSAAYLAMDVLALPTYREGYPNVVLEAAAAGRPTVTTTATGAVDSVIPGETGLVVPVRDASALATALGALLADPEAAARMGAAAAVRVAEHFRPEAVWQGFEEVYDDLLRERGGD